jgi:DNA-binding MarR family transcriptional regulator
MAADPSSLSPPQDVNDLDPVFLHRIRLGICVLLSETEYMTFPRLKELLDVTDGNLGAQLNNLREAGLVESRAIVITRRPATWYFLTPEGGSRLERHMDSLQRIIGRARGTASPGKETRSENYIG